MGGKEKESKKDRKAAKETEEQERKRQAEEDSKWGPADKKDKKKADREKEEAERKAQLAQKALEKKRLMEEDEANAGPSKGKAVPERLTRAQVEENIRKMQAESNKGKGKDRKVEVQKFEEINVNRVVEEEVASGVDDALKLMAATGLTETPKLMQAHKEFEERQIPMLKQQCPGLKMSQYKEMAWKLWQRSPENPMSKK